MANNYVSVVDEEIAKQNGTRPQPTPQKIDNDSPTQPLNELDEARQMVRNQVIAYVADGFVEGLESVARGDFGSSQPKITEALKKFSEKMAGNLPSTSPTQNRFTLNPGG